MLPPHEQGSCEGVSQRVEGEALIREPGSFEERLVLPVVEVVVVCRPADTIWEDETGILPRGGLQPLFVLGDLWARRAATAVLLRGTERRLALFFGGPKARPPSVTLRERRTESLPASSRSMSVHLSPSSSPCRSPVWTATM